MDSYELNKVLGALLGTCLVLLSLNITAGAIFSPATPKKPGYEIAVPEKAAPTPTGPTAPEEPIEKLLAAADVGRGEQAAKVCVTCHVFDKTGPTRPGPVLWGHRRARQGGGGGVQLFRGDEGQGRHMDARGAQYLSAEPEGHGSGNEHELRRHTARCHACGPDRIPQFARRQPGAAAEGGRGSGNAPAPAAAAPPAASSSSEPKP